MNKVGFDINKQLYSAFLVRCHEEGLNPDQVLVKWMERALRQKRTIIPMTEGEEERELSEQEPEASEVQAEQTPAGRVMRMRSKQQSAQAS